MFVDTKSSCCHCMLKADMARRPGCSADVDVVDVGEKARFYLDSASLSKPKQTREEGQRGQPHAFSMCIYSSCFTNSERKYQK